MERMGGRGEVIEGGGKEKGEKRWEVKLDGRRGVKWGRGGGVAEGGMGRGWGEGR